MIGGLWAGVKHGAPEGPTDFMALADEEIRAKLRFGNEAERLSVDRADGTARQALVERYDQNLSLAGRQNPDKLRVAAARGCDFEAKPAQRT